MNEQSGQGQDRGSDKNRNTQPSNQGAGALFRLGKVCATRNANDRMIELGIDPLNLIHRHVTGAWQAEVMDQSDFAQNLEAVATGEDRVFTVFVEKGLRIWVITEWDRSVTTILLPEDY